jgi:hypothetical protein
MAPFAGFDKTTLVASLVRTQTTCLYVCYRHTSCQSSNRLLVSGIGLVSHLGSFKVI